jgi:hypothetical protein
MSALPPKSGHPRLGFRYTQVLNPVFSLRKKFRTTELRHQSCSLLFGNCRAGISNTADSTHWSPDMSVGTIILIILIIALLGGFSGWGGGPFYGTGYYGGGGLGLVIIILLILILMGKI